MFRHADPGREATRSAMGFFGSALLFSQMPPPPSPFGFLSTCIHTKDRVFAALDPPLPLKEEKFSPLATRR